MSIRLRLTLWYAAVLAITLIGGSVALYLFLSLNVLRPARDQLLASKANPLAAALARRAEQAAAGLSPRRQLLPQFLNTLAEGDMLIAVRDADGETSDRSSNLGEEDLPLSEAARSAVLAGSSHYETASVEAVRLRLYDTPIVVNGQTVGVVQAALPTAPIEDTLRHLGNALVVGNTGLVLVGAAAGWFLAGRLLKPVRRITRTAEEIDSSGQLDRRVFYRGPRDELGNLAVAFNNMLGRLEASFNAQRRFVADASHELRTPLTTLRVNLEVLRRGRGSAPAEWGEVLDDMALELDRLTRLAEGLLRLERADAGQPLGRAPLVLDPLLERIERQVSQLASGVSLSISGPPVGSVLADADALTQLLLILLDNAIKFTPAGGTVRIERSRADEGICVRVVDSGPGIAPEDLPRVFDRFYRAASARGRVGTGLGLPIARWIAEAHGGRLTAESTPGKGSAFALWLPAERPVLAPA